VIGVLSTAAYVLLYLLFRGFAGAQAANLAALLLTAVGNTAANRRLTFGVRGRTDAARHQFRGLIAFAAGLVLTSGALAMLHAASPSPGRGTEVVVLVAANLAATLVRFALYRNWVFGSPRGGGTPPETSPPETALPEIALPEIALPETALPLTTPVDVINETTGSTR
jgi:putative flippase GtrA